MLAVVKVYGIIVLAVAIAGGIVSLALGAAHNDMVREYGYDPTEDPQGRTVREQLQDTMRTGTEKEKKSIFKKGLLCMLIGTVVIVVSIHLGFGTPENNKSNESVEETVTEEVVTDSTEEASVAVNNISQGLKRPLGFLSLGFGMLVFFWGFMQILHYTFPFLNERDTKN